MVSCSGNSSSAGRSTGGGPGVRPQGCAWSLEHSHGRHHAAAACAASAAGPAQCLRPRQRRTQHHAWRLPLLLALLLLLVLMPVLPSAAAASHTFNSFDPSLKTSGSVHEEAQAFEALTFQERAQYCEDRYQDLFEGVHADLARWKEPGISLELLQSSILNNTSVTQGKKGFVAGFFNGTAVLPDKPTLRSSLAHHAGLYFVYMQVLLDLQRLFGPLLPNCEFVISTIDRPVDLALNTSQVYEPVMRFCKTDSHADILIPIFHLNMRDHNSQLLAAVPDINARYPWAKREQVVFGRFSPYKRHLHPGDKFAQRRGANNSRICRNDNRVIKVCKVRTHFMQWAAQYKGYGGPDPLVNMDVASNPKIRMTDHAQYRYLVHLDGQGLSSRLDQLLPLGSLVFKEESGYRAYYHHLLKPYQHYVPFWKKYPEDILEAVHWAYKHDAEAQAIGAAGQAVALHALTRPARACYWFKLVQEYAKLLRYTPGPQKQPFMQHYGSIEDYIAKEAREWQEGRWLEAFPFSP